MVGGRGMVEGKRTVAGTGIGGGRETAACKRTVEGRR